MKTKIALAVSMALLSSAANAQTVLSPTGETIQLDIPAELSNDSTRGRLTAVNNQDVKFIPEPEFAEGEHTYIVRLRDSAVANYQGRFLASKQLAHNIYSRPHRQKAQERLAMLNLTPRLLR